MCCGVWRRETRLVNRLRLERHVFVLGSEMDGPGQEARHEVMEKLLREEVVVPIIDGTPLYEMVEDRYVGLGISFVALPSRLWLGTPTYGEAGRAVILDGSCEIAGCCGVFARITLTDDRVIWSDFRARGHPPLPVGLHFEFDRSQYEAAIASVASAPERRWSSTDATDDERSSEISGG